MRNARPALLLAVLLFVAAFRGSAEVSLAGSWKYHPGDDPAWGRPDFDDRQWRAIPLPSPRQIFGDFWLRRTASSPDCGDDCWLALGIFAPSYEVYIDGRSIGHTEDFQTAYTRYRQPLAFRISAVPPPGQPVTIALRVHSRQVFWGKTTQGIVDAGPYWITSEAHARDAVEAAKSRMRLAISPSIALLWILTGIASCLLVVWFSERDRRELLFFGAYLLALAAAEWVGIDVVFQSGSYSYVTYLYRPLGITGLLFLSMAVNRILGQRPLGTRILIPLSVLSLATDIALPQSILYILPWLGILVWQCILGIRSSFRSNWPVVFASLVFVIVDLNSIVQPWVLLFPLAFSSGVLTLSYTSASQILLGAVLLVLVLSRLSADRREKLRLSSEFEAARGVQQLLLASEAEPSRAYSVDAVYLPALEVGGDLYYALPGDDGSFTLVTGDVSGKGLKAALQVSLLVGALRDNALQDNQHRRSPGRLLQALNRTMYGQTAGGFITCWCALFAGDGTVTIASAGHLPPFFEGREVAVESGLPLGVAPDVEYSEKEILLVLHQQIMFVSDGVVEAKDQRGELFGFAHTCSISGKSAREVAHAAQAWGQNDDITVVTVRRTA